MKNLKTFAQFLNENYYISEDPILEKRFERAITFYVLNELLAEDGIMEAGIMDKTVKNPKTGRKTKISSVLKNKNHPLYAKVKNAVDKAKAKAKAKKGDGGEKVNPKKGEEKSTEKGGGDDAKKESLKSKIEKVDEMIEKLQEEIQDLKDGLESDKEKFEMLKDDGDDEGADEVKDQMKEKRDEIEYNKEKLKDLHDQKADLQDALAELN